ncbi:hypothetical protein M0802_001718 [Mischocyttarus mexicanus]|nr:hypothetical protein M0802_001718 [Mischocyttarus mexicanus]
MRALRGFIDIITKLLAILDELHAIYSAVVCNGIDAHSSRFVVDYRGTYTGRGSECSSDGGTVSRDVATSTSTTTTTATTNITTTITTTTTTLPVLPASSHSQGRKQQQQQQQSRSSPIYEPSKMTSSRQHSKT